MNRCLKWLACVALGLVALATVRTPARIASGLSPNRAPAAHPINKTPAQQPAQPPTLADLWNGLAKFVLDLPYVGLPMGESDTTIAPNGEWWSYLHASERSGGVHDQCGAAVPFPGCVVLYKSRNAGRNFTLEAPVCQIPCGACPCDAERDHVQQQQYPRVARAPNGQWVMTYEFGGRVMLRWSADGLAWSDAEWVFNTGVWTRQIRSCKQWEMVRPHPFATTDFECLAGGPPGVAVAGDGVYVFVALGQNPGALGCFTARLPLKKGIGMRFVPCRNNPLIVGSWDYGDLADIGPNSNAHFDFRTISSAEVTQVGDRYYLLYEGVRGPGPGDVGDTQFGLGLARSVTPRIDGPWEKRALPILIDLPGNIGLGHADVVMAPDGSTVLFTSVNGYSRSRFRLVWK